VKGTVRLATQYVKRCRVRMIDIIDAGNLCRSFSAILSSLGTKSHKTLHTLLIWNNEGRLPRKSGVKLSLCLTKYHKKAYLGSRRYSSTHS